MKGARDQAAAIDLVLQAGVDDVEREPIAFATITCANTLIEHGEFDRALVLVDGALSKLGPCSSRADLGIGLSRVRALLCLGRTPEAQDFAITLLCQFEDSGVNHLDEWAQLRAYEASCHWRRNDLAESIKRLNALRSELVLRPDGPATCIAALELGTALNLSGDRVAARASALEAWVAARRTSQPYWLALSEYDLALHECSAMRWVAARECLQSALLQFEHAGNRHMARRCMHLGSLVEWKTGLLAEALEKSSTLRVETLNEGLHQNYWYASLIRAVVLTHLGRFADAEKTLREEPDWQVPNKFSRASLLTAEFLGGPRPGAGQGRARAGTVHRGADAGDGPRAARGRRGGTAPPNRRVPPAAGQARRGARSRRARRSSTVARSASATTKRRPTGSSALRALRWAATRTRRRHSTTASRRSTRSRHPTNGPSSGWPTGTGVASEGSAAYRNESAAVEAYRAAMDHFERMGAEYKLGEARQRLEALEARMKREGAAMRPRPTRCGPLGGRG